MQVEWRGRRPEDAVRWLAALGTVLLTGGAVAALHVAGAGVCQFLMLTGVPCLTCGTTRAMVLLLTGRIWLAFVRQPLAVAAVLGVAGWLAVAGFGLLARRRVFCVRLSHAEKRRILFACVLAVAANWLYLVCWRGA